MTGFALFDTPIGRCGIAWDGDAIEGVQLPEPRAIDTRRRLQRPFDGPAGEAVEGTPPPAIQDAIDRMVASLRGEADDLADVPLDLDALPPFRRKVFEVVRSDPRRRDALVRRGRGWRPVRRARRARSARRSGRNPYPIVIPCHRVLAAGGRIGGFTATGGVSVKAKMLAAEGVTPRAERRPRQSVRPTAVRNAATIALISSWAADRSSGSVKCPAQVGEPGRGERGHRLHRAVEVERAVVARTTGSVPTTWRPEGSRPASASALAHLGDAVDGVGRGVAPRDPAACRSGARRRATRGVDGAADPDRHAARLQRLRHLVDAVEAELGASRTRRAARATASGSTSSVWSSSRPRPSKSRPAASYSSRCQPTPTPRSSRPPESTSSVGGRLRQHDRAPQRGEQDVGAEADPRRSCRATHATAW